MVIREVDLVLGEGLDRAASGLEQDPELEPRERGGESRQDRWQPAVRRVAARRDPQVRPGAGPRVVELALGACELRQDAVGPSNQRGSGRGEDEPLPDAIEEPHAQLPLQIDELVAHGGLREMKRACGARDSALARHRLDEAQVTDLEPARRRRSRGGRCPGQRCFMNGAHDVAAINALDGSARATQVRGHDPRPRHRSRGTARAHVPFRSPDRRPGLDPAPRSALRPASLRGRPSAWRAGCSSDHRALASAPTSGRYSRRRCSSR